MHLLSSDQTGSFTFDIDLEKEDEGGIGITIVGGKPDIGIFISDVKPDGPAYGILKEGDQLLAINGHKLDGLYHSAAVNIIKSSPEIVKLTVFRRSSSGPADCDDDVLPPEIYSTDDVNTHQQYSHHDNTPSSSTHCVPKREKEEKNLTHDILYKDTPSTSSNISSSIEQSGTEESTSSIESLQPGTAFML